MRPDGSLNGQAVYLNPHTNRRLVYVPGGSARSGCDRGGECHRDVHAFLADVAPVSRSEYRDYCLSCQKPRPTQWESGADDAPATHLTINEMKAYAEWAGQRFLSEAEWLILTQRDGGAQSSSRALLPDARRRPSGGALWEVLTTSSRVFFQREHCGKAETLDGDSWVLRGGVHNGPCRHRKQLGLGGRFADVVFRLGLSVAR